MAEKKKAAQLLKDASKFVQKVAVDGVEKAKDAAGDVEHIVNKQIRHAKRKESREDAKECIDDAVNLIKNRDFEENSVAEGLKNDLFAAVAELKKIVNDGSPSSVLEYCEEKIDLYNNLERKKSEQEDPDKRASENQTIEACYNSVIKMYNKIAEVMKKQIEKEESKK